jgi:hypothetical protein
MLVFPTLIAALLLVMTARPGAAQSETPLPPPRPAEGSTTAPANPPAEALRPAPNEQAPQTASEDDCLARLKSAGFTVEPAAQPTSSNELCRIDTPVRLSAVPVRSRPGTAIRVTEQPVLACRFADSFGHWIGDLVAPVLAGGAGSELKAVRTGPGFECRNRNRSATGKLSAHAEGLAIDISGFELANGATIRVKQESNGAQNPSLAALRTAACGWFTTVLGPGSDAAHDDHLHVDIIRHGSSDRYRICQ